ncbi:Alpha/Beta hydrolase protein [Podospora didyma]|uniref:Dipeptidyl-peptidase V n=1 Tax=Podospora didyma TaxID=330526 RepID=A0AAE0JY20_9PEZI|nr:Alpha/Beta hydrolase protein [Podospora didyma]
MAHRCGIGDGDYDVHALVMRPSNHDPKKKYPLCFLIHGGPQGAWGDGWSTRWNPAIFAEQGYVVVSPNPTGSTGYGMSLQNGIKGNWGGRPYNDLVKCFEYIEKEMPFVDTDRGVALGASYGGYMINWIQGHPLGRKFKALVCHDGVFSTLNQWSTEELFFPIHDFEGTIYENREGYARWDPAQFVNEWATHQLIIHSELDYRLPITEGLSPFNILQSKGIPSKLLMFPDENHWVLKPENSLV